MKSDESWTICSKCNGSGEGFHDGSTCDKCGGLGEVEHGSESKGETYKRKQREARENMYEEKFYQSSARR